MAIAIEYMLYKILTQVAALDEEEIMMVVKQERIKATYSYSYS